MHADTHRTHRRLIIAATALGLALLGAGAVVGLKDGNPGGRTGHQPIASAAPSSAAVLGPSTSSGRSDPRAFAIAAAEEVFEWDTTTATNTDGYFARLVEIADPGGVESDGLVADLTTYLPTPDTWTELRRYRTRQWLEIDRAEVPSTWEATARNGEVYGLEPGTTAYTITGVRHRAGIWNDRAVTSKHPVSFTVFIICGPRYPTCFLLRLSRIDHPLP